jgi:Tol biopolymer transport system component
LFAQQLDLTKLELTGEPVSVADDVASFPSDEGPTAYTSVAAKNGRLVYLSSHIAYTRLDWFNRDGKVVEPVADPSKYGEPWLSPDGKKIEFEQLPSLRADLWVLDIATKTTTRFTFDPLDDVGATWSPEGNYILFASNRTGKHQLYKRLASGAGTDELVVPTDFTTFPDDWKKLADGREVIVFEMVNLTSRFDIYIYQVNGDQKPVRVIGTEFNETHAQISPDGKFIAYSSDESGRSEVYVQTFPATGAKWQVSTSGADQAQWKHDGSELFYMSADKKLMSVKTTLAPSFNSGPPTVLFQTRVPSTLLTADRNNYRVSNDGQRFLVNTLVETDNVESATVIMNWASALK